LIIEHTIANTGFKVFVSDQLLERMYVLAAEYLPREFGGILTGYRQEKSITIVDFEVPTSFDLKHNEFVRQPESLNEYLQRIYQHSSGLLEYLGEWHSHPNHSAGFSTNDRKSMLEIADDPKIKVNNPLLVILSMMRRANSYKLYQVVNKELKWLNKTVAL